MNQQKLDEDGLASSYLLLTAILPCTLYFIYSITRKRLEFFCRCKYCLRKKPHSKKSSWIVLSILILVISFLIRNILTIKIKKAKVDFDPYTILNITVESTVAEAKKNYRKLLKTFNKKLNTKETKKLAEEGIKKLNMAYSMVKDPKALDAFLNNTSTSELLIALPSFIINFSTPFLIFYVALIAIILPLVVYSKYKKMQKIGSTGSEFVSNENFLNEFDNFSDLAAVIMQQIFVLIGESNEFVNRKWADEISEDMAIEKSSHIPLVTRSTGYLKLILYLSRKIDSSEDRLFIATTSLNLLSAYKKIAIEKDRASVLENIIICEKLIVQEIPGFEFSLAQYPGISIEQAFEQTCKLGETKKSFQMEEEYLKEVLSENEFKTAIKVLKDIPNVTIKNLRAFTYEVNDTNEDNGEKVFLTDATKAVAKEGDFFLIPKDSACNVAFDLVSQNTSPICHSPVLESPLENKWYVFAAINDKLFGGLILLDQFEGKKSIQIGVPFSNGKFMVRVYILSNGYFGNNLLGTLNIKFI